MHACMTLPESLAKMSSRDWDSIESGGEGNEPQDFVPFQEVDSNNDYSSKEISQTSKRDRTQRFIIFDALLAITLPAGAIFRWREPSGFPPSRQVVTGLTPPILQYHKFYLEGHLLWCNYYGSTMNADPLAMINRPSSAIYGLLTGPAISGPFTGPAPLTSPAGSCLLDKLAFIGQHPTYHKLVNMMNIINAVNISNTMTAINILAAMNIINHKGSYESHCLLTFYPFPCFAGLPEYISLTPMASSTSSTPYLSKRREPCLQQASLKRKRTAASELHKRKEPSEQPSASKRPRLSDDDSGSDSEEEQSQTLEDNEEAEEQDD